MLALLMRIDTHLLRAHVVQTGELTEEATDRFYPQSPPNPGQRTSLQRWSPTRVSPFLPTELLRRAVGIQRRQQKPCDGPGHHDSELCMAPRWSRRAASRPVSVAHLVSKFSKSVYHGGTTLKPEQAAFRHTST